MDTQIVVNSYKIILLTNEEDESQKLCPEWKQLNMRVGSVWFHLCEVLKQVKLIHGGGRNATAIISSESLGCEGGVKID